MRLQIVLAILVGVLASSCSPAASPQQTHRDTRPDPTAPVYEYRDGNQGAYDTTFFKDYGVNPSIDTLEDNLSTFAMDVDTASYTVARGYVNEGNLPDLDSVRVEEFVNYFRHDYESPEYDTFSIHLDGAPAPFGDRDSWLVRVGLKAREVSERERKDPNLIFVVDVSGSMARDDRLGLVKRSLRLLVDQMWSTDSVGIVVYGTNGRVLLEPTRVSNRSKILRAVDQLETEGATNAEEGLRLGYEMASEHFESDEIVRVILCSDGVANVGRTTPDAILRTVRRRAEEGITLSTLGFGLGNYNDVLLEQLADDGDGNYAYIDTYDEARRVFTENLTGLLQVVARDAKIQVDFNPDSVDTYRLLGYENRVLEDDEFRDDSVDAGEVGAGHTVTALYEIELSRGASGRLLTARIRYQDPDTEDVHEVSSRLNRSDLERRFDEMPADFQLDAAVAEYAEILRDSFWAREGSLEDVFDLALSVRRQLDDDDVDEFVDLVAESADLRDGVRVRY